MQDMQETQVRSLGQKDPLEEGMATHPLQYSCLENLTDKGTMVGYSPELDMTQHARTSEVLQRDHLLGVRRFSS